jgi:hypothetical protein
MMLCVCVCARFSDDLPRERWWRERPFRKTSGKPPSASACHLRVRRTKETMARGEGRRGGEEQGKGGRRRDLEQGCDGEDVALMLDALAAQQLLQMLL